MAQVEEEQINVIVPKHTKNAVLKAQKLPIPMRPLPMN